MSPKEVTANASPFGGWVDGVIRTFDGLEALQVRSIQDWPDSLSCAHDVFGANSHVGQHLLTLAWATMGTLGGRTKGIQWGP